jgi:hypothetical protein
MTTLPELIIWLNNQWKPMYRKALADLNSPVYEGVDRPVEHLDMVSKKGNMGYTCLH